MQKNDIIEQGTMKNFLTIKKLFYEEGLNSNNKLLYEIYGFDKETTDNCISIYESIRRRRKHSLNEIAKWCFAISKIPKYKKYIIVFGTLTFKDIEFKKTTKKTRRIIVSRFLRNNANIEHYIANIDYGEENGREHYHFLALCRGEIDQTWSRGFTWYKKVKIEPKNIKKTMKYIMKLNNHAFKESTRLEKIIMDRKKENVLDGLIKVLYLKEFREYKVTNLDMKLTKTEK